MPQILQDPRIRNWLLQILNYKFEVDLKKSIKTQKSYFLLTMPRVPLDPRITVRAGQDFNEYQRQKAYLRSHTDCLVIPPKQHRKPRKGPNKSDPRITVTFKDDRKEYFRQKKYVEKHPDCVEIPPKRGRLSQVGSLQLMEQKTRKVGSVSINSWKRIQMLNISHKKSYMV